MYLYINTAQDKMLKIALVTKNKIIDEISLSGDYHVSEKLLLSIQQLLSQNKIGLKSLRGIITIIGPGPFTSLRIAAVISNTLAYALHLPLVGLKLGKAENTDESLIKKGLLKLKKVKKNNYLLPFYNQDPNITLK